ncbi:MAG: hypothetical protein BWY06_01870 [Candidatus Latescibacteria bacterium ADurb.Bin168]|nr:MAG: hypothetical protein BWY06_01870 [Candidatus Latescibacteria bacterium ADurb.Bin168]
MRFLDRHCAQLGERHPAKFHGSRLRAKPHPPAIRAAHRRSERAQLLFYPFVLRFPELAFQHGDDSFERVEVRPSPFAGIPGVTKAYALPVEPVEKLFLREFRNVLPWRVETTVTEMMQNPVIQMPEPPVAVYIHRRQRSLPKRFRGIGNQQVPVDLHLCPEAQACGAHSRGYVERKELRCRFFVRNPTFSAGVRGSHDGVGSRVLIVADHVYDQRAVSHVKRGIHRLRKPGADPFPHDQSVDDDVNIVLCMPVETGVLAEIDNAPVHPRAHETLALQLFEQVEELSLSATRHRRENVEARPGGMLQNLVKQAIPALSGDRLPALNAVQCSEACVQNAEVVVHLRHRSYRASGIASGRLLFYRNRGRKAGNLIYVRLLHLLHELPGVCGKRLDVPALPFGVDGVERHRALAGTRNAGEADQTVLRQSQVHRAKVVHSCTADDYLISAHATLDNPKCRLGSGKAQTLKVLIPRWRCGVQFWKTTPINAWAAPVT